MTADNSVTPARWPTPAWEERLRVASDRLPDGRLRVRAEGISDSAPVLV